MLEVRHKLGDDSRQIRSREQIRIWEWMVRAVVNLAIPDAEIEIYCARRIAIAASFPAKLALDVVQMPAKAVGFFIRLKPYGGVQKIRLPGRANSRVLVGG
jgi:hypothetical protein